MDFLLALFFFDLFDVLSVNESPLISVHHCDWLFFDRISR